MKLIKGLLQFRKWVKSMRPKADFSLDNVPPTPDYANMDFWAAHPSIESKALLQPEGDKTSDNPLEADAFYIHPTSYFGNQNWNYDFKHPQATELIDEELMTIQASTLNNCCRIFAPRYRQATFHTFIKNEKNGRKAMELAYSDVLAAFKYYLKHENNGRPFFIYSHSQGTCHAIRLLEEFIDKHECVHRLVAAYAIGFQFPEEKFSSGQFQNIQIAESATDTGCVIAYDTFMESGQPPHLVDKSEIYYPNKKKWIKRAFKKPVCVNPVTWTRDLIKIDGLENGYLGAAMLQQAGPVDVKLFGKDEKMGMDVIAIKAPEMEKLKMEVRKDGFLYISRPENKMLRRILLPMKSLHCYDYHLFYYNIRENAKDRLSAYLAQIQ